MISLAGLRLYDVGSTLSIQTCSTLPRFFSLVNKEAVVCKAFITWSPDELQILPMSFFRIIYHRKILTASKDYAKFIKYNIIRFMLCNVINYNGWFSTPM